jgi:hypothetical protein
MGGKYYWFGIYWYEYILIYTGIYSRVISADHRMIIATSYWYIPVYRYEYLIYSNV